ncbi:class I SAM-dependent methyltransferase [Gordonia insulae]|uniref:class I SAM-dependent methyltransferase n=1 Tax=Gordonia insulae TaxID=2420509 RepID=UPI000F5C25BF|nr:class I SAM-dependent methyltransferase [Gordonia insulae]
MPQPGYDAMADLYIETFPSPYATPLERHLVAAFADLVAQDPVPGVVVDIGCGPGQITADLAARGLSVIGVDPSREMLRIARRDAPTVRFVQDDAHLGSTELADVDIAAILARFSLIHVPPSVVPDVLAGWAGRLAPGALVAVAGQTIDSDEITEFDHAVAPAWRWYPDRLSDALSTAGFDELWRTVSRPDTHHRFPAVHLVARRR